jgi:hypothetical protein
MNTNATNVTSSPPASRLILPRTKSYEEWFATNVPVGSLNRYPIIQVVDGRLLRLDDEGIVGGIRRFPISDPAPIREVSTALRWLEDLPRFRKERRWSWHGSHEIKQHLEWSYGGYTSAGVMALALNKMGIALRPDSSKVNYEMHVPSKWATHVSELWSNPPVSLGDECA